jgi:hypothetical protein
MNNVPTAFRRRGILLALLAGVAACDPCTGLSVCGTPAVDASGEVVFHLTQGGAEAVLVRFERTGGAAISPEVLEAVSDAQGRFRLIADAAEPGVVRGTLSFRPPEPFQAFVFGVEDVEIFASRARGSSRFIGRWGVGPLPAPPHITYTGQLVTRFAGLPVAGAEVVVERTGGVATTPSTYSTRTLADGRFWIRMGAEGAGEAIFSVRVVPPPPYRPETLERLVLPVLLGRDEVRDLGRWGVGYQIFYTGELVWADTGSPAAGVEVEFRRTGGLPVEPSTVTTRTGGDGRFYIHLEAFERGDLLGEVIVRSPGAHPPFTIANLVLSASERFDPTLLGVWEVRR